MLYHTKQRTENEKQTRQLNMGKAGSSKLMLSLSLSLVSDRGLTMWLYRITLGIDDTDRLYGTRLSSSLSSDMYLQLVKFARYTFAGPETRSNHFVYVIGRTYAYFRPHLGTQVCVHGDGGQIAYPIVGGKYAYHIVGGQPFFFFSENPVRSLYLLAQLGGRVGG